MESTSRPKYSIIICAYNMERYLRQCLDSVLAQDSLSSYEILLIDNGSTDGTGAICDEYTENHSCIRLTRIKENRGGARGINAGLAVARGEYILFLDSDDLWMPNLLSTLDPLTKEQPDMLVFGSEFFNDLNPAERSEHTPFTIPNGESGLEWTAEWKNPFPYAVWFYGWNHSFMEKYHLEQDSDFERVGDFDRVARGLTVAGSIRGTDRALHRYRIRADSVSHILTLENVLNFLKDWATIYYRYHYPFAADRYCMEAIQVAYLDDRKEAEESVRFIKDHWDILEDVRHPHSKVARLLFRTFGIYNGARVYIAAHRVKSGIGRKKAAF